MKGYSERKATKLAEETGYHVEYNPHSKVSPYIIDGVGAASAAEVRRIASHLEEWEAGFRKGRPEGGGTKEGDGGIK